MVRPNRCGQCGAELRLGPACCPLCGSEVPQRQREAKSQRNERLTVEDYQSNVRELREQLESLKRGGAEAV